MTPTTRNSEEGLPMLAGQLAEYASKLSYRDLPQSVIHEVKRRILDSLACTYGAMTASPCKISRRLAEAVTSKEGATIWGTAHRTTPDLATFANGSLVRYLDFNDTYLSKEPAHPSDNIPACLAAAEREQVSGKRLIVAIVLAYEVQCRLCDVVALRPRGWDHVTFGSISASIAVAKLLNLSIDRMVHAINLTGITAGALRQTRVGEVSFWKACAFANAARNAVFLTYAAGEGMTGPPAMFEGEKGFMNVIAGKFSLAELGGKNGAPFKILDTYIKPYPVEYHAQSAIEVAFNLRQQLRNTQGTFDPSLVASIEIESFDVAIEIIGRDREKWNPQTRETADHSLPYCAAVALIDGKISPQSFSAARLKDKTLLDLVQKVRVTENKAFTARYPGAMPNRIQVALVDGQKVAGQVDWPKGHPRRPLSDEDLEGKFHSLADGKIGKQKANHLIQRIWELEKCTDMGTWIGKLPFPSRG